jgi:hypothetical protein
LDDLRDALGRSGPFALPRVARLKTRFNRFIADPPSAQRAGNGDQRVVLLAVRDSAAE